MLIVYRWKVLAVRERMTINSERNSGRKTGEILWSPKRPLRHTKSAITDWYFVKFVPVVFNVFKASND